MKNKIKIGLAVMLSFLILLNMKFYLEINKNYEFFGVKLGEVLDKKIIINSYSSREGNIFYNIKVNKKFEKVGYTYTVQTVPETNEIYSISIRKKINSSNFKIECYKEKEKLEKEMTNNFSFGRNDIENIDIYLNQDLFVYFACADIDNYFVATYYNRKIYKI